MDEARLDGTQAPPPPRTFPDPLAGLVTGEVRHRPEAVPPVVAPPLLAAPTPAPAHVQPVRRPPARRQAARPAQATGQPAQHDPHAELARRLPRQDTAPFGQATPPGRLPRKDKGGLVGCLAVLAVVGGLLFNVLREIVEAVIDLLR